MKKLIFYLLLCLLISSELNAQYGYSAEHQHKIEGNDSYDDWSHVKSVILGGDGADQIFVAADGTMSSRIVLTDDYYPGTCAFGPPQFVDGPYGYGLDPNYDPIFDGEIIDFKCINGVTSFIYRHPQEFSEADLYGNGLPTIGIYDNSGSLIGKIIVNIRKIPILMIHGLWANSLSFEAMENHFLAQSTSLGESLYDDFMIRRMDYSTSHQDAFNSNYPKVQNEIASLIKLCRYNNMSAGKVNLVVHSMGGILSRLHLANKYQYCVNRLITCNTPHSGSQMASFLIQSAPPQVCHNIAHQMNPDTTATSTLCGSAIFDLQVGSFGISNLNAGAHPKEVDVHAVVTIQDLSISNLAVDVFTTLIFGDYLELLVPCVVSNIFGMQDSDIVVAENSQQGGLVLGKTTTIYDQMHVGSTANPAVINAVFNLLEEPELTSTKYTNQGFSPPVLSYNGLPASCIIFPKTNSAATTAVSQNPSSSVTISSPSANANYNIGDSVLLTVNVGSGIDTILTSFMLQNDSIQVVKTAVNGTANIILPIPANSHLGLRPIVVAGMDANSLYTIYDSRLINVSTSASLIDIEVSPNNFYMSDNQTENISITGVYDDGNSYNLNQELNFQYSFSTGNASANTGNIIELDLPGNDTFTLSLNGITSNTVTIDYSAPCLKEDNIWIGPSTGSYWHDSEAHWSLGSIPNVCDKVIIPNGNEVSINIDRTGFAYTLTVENNAVLDVPLSAALEVRVK